jgi:hypothetical protein
MVEVDESGSRRQVYYRLRTPTSSPEFVLGEDQAVDGLGGRGIETDTNFFDISDSGRMLLFAPLTGRDDIGFNGTGTSIWGEDVNGRMRLILRPDIVLDISGDGSDRRLISAIDFPRQIQDASMREGRGSFNRDGVVATNIEFTDLSRGVFKVFIDDDEDGLADQWEVNHLGSLAALPSSDTDGDGLSEIEEFRFGTDPNQTDSDGDGASDLVEVQAGTNPRDSAN